MKNYMALVKYFYFGRVEIVGREKIPVGKPIIYSCNHQNAFMDALLIGSISPIRITSLTRSDVFGSHAGMWFMTALQMQPIYRMRDGISQLEKNEMVFENVRSKLRKKEGVLIFSEGNHANNYYLRTLSKGSSRMALESQEKMEELDIQVVPVGINYFHHQRPFHKLCIVFEDPISVKDYFDLYKEHPAKSINQLKASITEGMKKCLMLPENSDDYIEKLKYVNQRNESVLFKDFVAARPGDLKAQEEKKPGLKSLGIALGIFNFLPLLLLQVVLKPIKDIVFYGSLKWASALFVLPLYWVSVLLVFGLTLGWVQGVTAMILCIITLFLRQWLIKKSNVPH